MLDPQLPLHLSLMPSHSSLVAPPPSMLFPASASSPDSVSSCFSCQVSPCSPPSWFGTSRDRPRKRVTAVVLACVTRRQCFAAKGISLLSHSRATHSRVWRPMRHQPKSMLMEPRNSCMRSSRTGVRPSQESSQSVSFGLSTLLSASMVFRK